MKNRNIKQIMYTRQAPYAVFFFGLILLACTFFITCNLENPIMEKWWEEPTPKKPEAEYITITNQLPPKILIQYIEKDVFIERIKSLGEDEIVEIIQKIDPEKIIEYLTETQIGWLKEKFTTTEYITVEQIVEVIVEKEIELTNDQIIEIIQHLPAQELIEYLTETQIGWLKEQYTSIEYITKYITTRQIEEVIVEKEPTIEQIIDIIRQLPAQELIEYLTEAQIQWLKDKYTTIETITVEQIVEVIVEKEIELTNDQIIEIIQHLPPQELIQYLTDEQIEWLKEQFTTIEYITEYITTKQIEEVIVEKEPTIEQIIEIIQQFSVEELIQYLTDEQIMEIIKQLDPQVLVEYLTETQIEYILQQLPPQWIIEHLTEEQIKYIVDNLTETQIVEIIQQLPPQAILQNVTVIDIQFIIFGGDSRDYNVNMAGKTPIDEATMRTNNIIIAATAAALKANPEYVIMVHGHSNPTKLPSDPNYAQELQECADISEARAADVIRVLNTEYGGGGIDQSRIISSGYGGARNIADPSRPELNRRVEIIIFNVSIN